MYFSMKLFGVVTALTLLTLPSLAFAHVSVKPASVGVGSFQTFIMGVPSEKEIPTTEIKLLIPAGLEHVRPNVKPGWTIDMVKSGEGHDALVTEITWKGGSIGGDFRDDFYFSAKVPPTEQQLAWKAYQTYADGSVVSWDQDPAIAEDAHDEDAEAEAGAEEAKEEEDFSKQGPYSTTAVIDDLRDADHGGNKTFYMKQHAFMLQSLPSILGLIAIGIALAALIRRN